MAFTENLGENTTKNNRNILQFNVLAVFQQALNELLSEYNDYRDWKGELSSSALAAPTAVYALSIVSCTENKRLREN